jgi:endoglucanase
VTNASIYISPDQPTITAAHANATFTVSLDHPLAYSVTVHYATKDGTAVAGTDYTAESGDLTFAAGQLHQTVSVPILTNPNASSNPVFYVDLSNPAASGGAAPAISVSEATEAISAVPPTSVDTGISDNIMQNADGTQTETQNVATATPNAPIFNSLFDANGDLVNASFKNEDGSSVVSIGQWIQRQTPTSS